MKLSLIILNYESAGLVRECIRGIHAARLALSYEIIVVDNNSGDGVGAMLARSFPGVRFIGSPVNGGCAAGNNLGLLAAQGAYALILNPDIAVLPGAIETLVTFLDAHPDAALVAPQLVNPDGTTQLSCFRFPDPLIPILRRTPLGNLPGARRRLRAYLLTSWDHTDTRTVDWVLGACMLVRMEAVERVGLMDERFFLYFEDVDWCRRFWAAGYKIYYHPASRMVHYHRRLSAVNPGLKGILSASTRVHIVSGLRYFAKYGFHR